MQLIPAQFYHKLPENQVVCDLCPHHCVISDGKTGICRVRLNQNGNLFATTFGKIAALHLDPIEKKPLYHFFPGKSILSIGTVGCNLRCNFCQNASISQTGVEGKNFLREYELTQIVSLAEMSENNIGIAFTYNEPGIWIEFVTELAALNHMKGLHNVMVTNGYLDANPMKKIIEVTDAFSVDLKGFSETFYKSIVHGNLKPVLDNLELIKQSGRYLELVNLVIPGVNDDTVIFGQMIEWISKILGNDTVLHLSAYFPHYLSSIPPTPHKTLLELQKIARSHLHYVYCGNIPGEENHTHCNNCGNLLITRHNYQVVLPGLDTDGACRKCKKVFIQNF